MEGPTDTAGSARCPDHPGSRVVRNGTATVAAGPRQKYLCRPADGRPHSFTVDSHPLHPLAERSQPTISAHRYATEAIARGLVAVARGATYRQARLTVQTGEAPGTVDGRLVSRWVETFVPHLRPAAAPDQPPSVVATRTIDVGRTAERRASRYLLALVACGARTRTIVWPVGLAETPDTASWTAVLERTAGRPRIVVCGTAVETAAVIAHWGTPAVRLPGPDHGATLIFEPSRDTHGHDAHDLDTHDLDTRPAGISPKTNQLLRLLATRAEAVRSPGRARLVTELIALYGSGMITPDGIVSTIRAA